MHTIAELLRGELYGITSLTISEELTTFPVAIFELADTLEYLDLSFNNLSALPDDFGRLTKLKIFFCGNNQFKELPAVLGDCPLLNVVGFKSNQIEVINPKAVNPNVRWLILTNNKLSSLPKEIGNCFNLQKLMLAGNRLRELPETLQNCKNLSLLRISANKLTHLPNWMFSMPKLAWLAFSGNAFSKKTISKSMSLIDLNDLNFHEKLGEGASGIIYKADRNVDGKKHDVAVKIFKSGVTSDGLPDDEMNAHILAGDHEGIVKIIGHIDFPEEDKTGLMMELIPHHFYNLGKPPNFDTCVRDTFDGSTKLSINVITKIAATIASIANQLHERGIMHGDLYAHNILIDQDGNALFGDFGAATIYNKQNLEHAATFERFEVLAFGYLLDDLLKLNSEPHHSSTKLEKLRDKCLVSDVFLRPTFKNLYDELIGY
ncbi:leucine-rich repeat-containing protein kinase family protein [Pedobacter mucosus]|uniref:leucine-rich repeat-containing protein kinase family protein n=1 Tax=Pedobacter mucosus TaxID=2895286 RepID=UPI001EE43430|nr:leucine-rich repeat-containing protein kinase family protein [Pedobacter mucosus]UKT64668.1 leucine-rich repeat-containing serine/threonine-protein kinase [Pedobacter mucosus]